MSKSSFALSCAMLLSVVAWSAGMVAFNPPEHETISLAPDSSYPASLAPILPPDRIEVVGPQPNPETHPAA